MLTLSGQQERFCDGIHRRNFLQLGAFGVGLSLADLLRLRAATANQKTGVSASRARSAIMIFLRGGPSHLDMWDLKPEAPVEFRGEFQPIPTNIAGVQICEHFPRQAQMFDKLAVVRSLSSVNEHSDTLVMTGYPDRVNRTAKHPSFGSVISKLSQDAHDVPPFVSLRGLSRGCEPGYLGVAHRAFTTSGPGLKNLKLARGVDQQRLNTRQDLLSRFDSLRRDVDASGTMEGLDAFSQQAFDMIASGTVRQALDLKREEPRNRDRYKGLDAFLTARRLIEAGVGCVTLAYGGWDTHNGNFKKLRKQLPQLDRGIANLIQDLHDRGMQDDVVTVVWGEFGRTPKVNNNQGGRDHWAPAMSALVAGGGLQMGQAIGATSERGERPVESPYKVQNLLSTFYQAMGIDPATTFPNESGRPMYLLDDREPVQELLG